MGNAEQEVRVFPDEVYSHAGGVLTANDPVRKSRRRGRPEIDRFLHPAGLGKGSDVLLRQAEPDRIFSCSQFHELHVTKQAGREGLARWLQ